MCTCCVRFYNKINRSNAQTLIVHARVNGASCGRKYPYTNILKSFNISSKVAERDIFIMAPQVLLTFV